MKKLCFAMALALITAPLAAQEVERVSGDRIAIYNLAGHVELVRGSGSDVVVRIDRGGSDASRLTVETGEIRGWQTLRIIYPADEVVYPEMGRSSSTSTRVRDDGTFSDGGGSRGDQIRIRGSGRGLEAWADLVIEVPVGQEASVYLAAGRVEARGVDGDIGIDTGSGRVGASDMAGALSIDTGSGSVTVSGMAGDLNVDTGAGAVEVSDVVGDLNVDTGAGGVEVSDVVGGEVDLDTGAGKVVGRGIEAQRLVVDTGAGSVELDRVASPDVSVDTGTGSVTLTLISDVESLDVDTGSGSVTIRAPRDLGAEIEIDTSSGGIDVDFPVEVFSARRDHLEGRIGDGRGEIVIDTGSGSVRLIRN